MENNILPDPNTVFPVPNINTVTYIKPTIKNKNIIVEDFTYFSDVYFEEHVTHFYEFYNEWGESSNGLCFNISILYF
jgi:virginiamycin A acetyltransferase